MNLTDTVRFFLVYPLDLEAQGLQELEEKFLIHFPHEKFNLIKKEAGGIEIECSLQSGLYLNSILRTPTRILLRLTEFKCRDAPKLYQKISKFNWANWLIGQIPEVHASATNSRLFDSRKIIKAIQDGIEQFYRHKPVKKKYLEYFEQSKSKELPKIYFRAIDDICTLSIDTTGERLHIRGEKILTGLAPIRENIAALLLKILEKNLNSNEYTLIDPMCGSGTFLLEAASSNAITTSRDFSFLHLPVYLDSTIKIVLDKKNEQSFFRNYLGFDINPEVIKMAQDNCQSINNISLSHGDLFLSKKKTDIDKSAVIINPPYGIRVGSDLGIDINYYLKIINAINTVYAPTFLGIIIPSDYKLVNSKEHTIVSKHPFKNGGIDVVFYVLKFK